MWEYFLYVCLLCLILIVLACVILRLIKLNTKWDRSTTCLVGKTAIVTGANSGIGFYTAQEFAKRGARVILACRSATRGEEAKKKIVEATHNENVHVRIVDFESLKSVREFGRGINMSEERLDILVNNAGAIILKNEITVDGLSKSMQVNHFGPFLLTLLLIDLMKKSKSGRIVIVSSAIAHFVKININNLNSYSNWFISKIRLADYAITKLYNILFANELARRLKGSGITINSIHPGSVSTEIGRDFLTIFQKLNKYATWFLRNAEEGAQTSIYVSLSKDLDHVTGEYFDNCGPSRMPKAAQDMVLAKKIWEGNPIETNYIIYVIRYVSSYSNPYRSRQRVSGIGFYTAQEFAKRGARVILACRNITRAEEAKRKIVEATKNNNVHVRIVDFASLKSVREFAKRINGSEERLDILVNNAGAVILKNETTVDGLSKSMQVNHFGPFLLTLLLIDLMKKSKSGRIVIVSSAIAHFVKININNLNAYSNWFISNIRFTDYATTKLYNILFANELARRLKGIGITINSVHPGLVRTEIGRDFPTVFSKLSGYATWFVRNAEEGAQTSIYVSLSKDLDHVTGEYFDNCGPSRMPKAAQDMILGKKIWEVSTDCVQLSKEKCIL